MNYLSKKQNILDFIGDTPILLLKHLRTRKNINIYVKLEYYNPGGSIKARVANHMIRKAEESGILTPFSHQTIIEPTGGNTGRGLAIVGALRGYRVVLVIPNSTCKEKIDIVKHYGAEVILSDSSKGPKSHISTLLEILKKNTSYVFLNQFKNIANPEIHYLTTGNEISKKIKRIDFFVSSVGSGGTISGVGKRLRENNSEVKIIAVQPEGCDIIKGKAICHSIEGTAVGINPSTLDKSIIDGIVDINEEEVFKIVHHLAIREGIFVGPSSAANVLAAIKLSKSIYGKANIVTLAPDSGINYLSLYSNKTSIMNL